LLSQGHVAGYAHAHDVVNVGYLHAGRSNQFVTQRSNGFDAGRNSKIGDAEASRVDFVYRIHDMADDLHIPIRDIFVAQPVNGILSIDHRFSQMLDLRTGPRLRRE